MTVLRNLTSILTSEPTFAKLSVWLNSDISKYIYTYIKWWGCWNCISLDGRRLRMEHFQYSDNIITRHKRNKAVFTKKWTLLISTLGADKTDATSRWFENWCMVRSYRQYKRLCRKMEKIRWMNKVANVKEMLQRVSKDCWDKIQLDHTNCELKVSAIRRFFIEDKIEDLKRRRST